MRSCVRAFVFTIVREYERTNARMKRYLVGIPLAIAVILMLVYVPPLVVQLVIVTVSMIGMSEYMRLVLPSRDGLFFILAILFSGLLTAGIIFLPVSFAVLLFSLIVMFSFVSRFKGFDDFDVKLNTVALLSVWG